MPGVYLHIPFCARRCHYCDFNTYAGIDDVMPAYVSALTTDIRKVAQAGPQAVAPPGADVGSWPEFTSVFVGGGTPTYLPAGDLAGIVRLVAEVLPVADDAEITVEANPETVDVAYFRKLRDAGVNRVSMGAQSFSDHVLQALGRWHDPKRPLRAVADARQAGIANVSLDLIYGTPGETDGDWQQTLSTALDAQTTHISAYALTVEPNTEYAARVRRATAAAPDDDVQARRMAVTDDVLTAAGFTRYELSNWARPGMQCRHNLTYWRNGDWLGIGAGAHGHWQGRRWWSVRAPQRYVDEVVAGRSTTSGDEVLDLEQQRTERLLLGLRMADGVPRRLVEPVDPAAVAGLVDAGLLIADDRLRLAPQGWPLANDVTVRLLP
ncbi:MAG TPA: radical SAM family heme chaperone HemW [Egibacteraceae bacterium]|nr:radical SAM family heme chaperone HemW [Egibacteraceae bacterium]